jgi:hypothetical protein
MFQKGRLKTGRTSDWMGKFPLLKVQQCRTETELPSGCEVQPEIRAECQSQTRVVSGSCGAPQQSRADQVRELATLERWANLTSALGGL